MAIEQEPRETQVEPPSDDPMEGGGQMSVDIDSRRLSTRSELEVAASLLAEGSFSSEHEIDYDGADEAGDNQANDGEEKPGNDLEPESESEKILRRAFAADINMDADDDDDDLPNVSLTDLKSRRRSTAPSSRASSLLSDQAPAPEPHT